MIKDTISKVQIKYSSINVQKFAQFDVADFTLNGENDLEYVSDFQAHINEERQEFGVTSTVRVKIISIDEIFCELKVTSMFLVKPFDIIKIDKERNKMDIPENLIHEVTDIIMSTVRGILHERLRGTKLQNEVLPLIAANKVLPT
ncbi:hypothetical protein [Kaistella sp.]|uniref:hypothetical protein n=1 Tax=Kaistella sp. TaxID=2782235 RepID=UPI003C64E4FB